MVGDFVRVGTDLVGRWRWWRLGLGQCLDAAARVAAAEAVYGTTGVRGMCLKLDATTRACLDAEFGAHYTNSVCIW
jgi:hypothetical protein